MKYREIIPYLSATEEWKDIKVNIGSSHSTLQDIKVPKQAAGFCYRNDEFIRNRFIYWRTSDDVLELSENSLDVNLKNKNLRITFEESPILSVHINESEDNVTILVVTISNIHRLQFIHPRRSIGSNGEQNENSIFSSVTQDSIKEPTSYYAISNLLAQNVPHCASCYLSPTSEEAYFAVAHTNHLLLFQMNCFNGHTGVTELKNFQMLPRIFSNLTDAIRGKSNISDSNYVTSIVFDTVGGENVLYALYRDNTLRMWSTRTGQCLSTQNITKDNDERSQGTQNNKLKRSTTSTTLCVFLSYTNSSEFQLFKPTWDGANNYSIVHTNLITAPQYDLLDFELTDQKLWGLWCNSEGDMHISAYSLEPVSMECWRTAILEGISVKQRVVEAEMDAKHVYCSAIFRPGKFQSSTISKALVMFSRSTNFSDAFTPMHILKERVCQAIDAEIQNEMKMHDLSEDEFIEVAINNWEKFYSCCEQYHIAAHQPIGLFVLDSLDAVCVIKHSLMSFLRPCDTIENMLLSGLCPENILIEQRLKEDLGSLVKIAYYLENNLSVDVKIDISNNMFKLKMPNDIVSELISEMSTDEDSDVTIPRELIKEIADRLKRIRDVQSVMGILLNLLRLDRNNFSDEEFNDDLTPFQRQLFDGNYGTSVVTETVRQITSSRYAMCRNLLIIQHILIDGFSLNCNEAEIIRSKHIPETVIFLQSYYVMLWVGEEAFAVPQTKTNVIGFNNQGGYNQPSSLLQLFVKNKGLQSALKLHFKSDSMDDDVSGADYETENFWSKNLLSIASYIERFIWAISGRFVFGEWLAETQQNLLIEEYVRLLNKWCEYNSCSRHFILAMTFLDTGETQKAYDMFIESAKGVLSEPYLMQFVNASEYNKSNEIMAQYYLKVMRLFEKHEVYDCVISLAEVAIGAADKESQLAMFQSIIFNNHMHLKHYEEAYHSLIHNVELSRRKDCLRQLVIMLFQEKRFDILINFPYIGLEQDLQNIVETRARSMQIENNEHYNFLYSYHIKNNNMKKAAIVMYEKALRFLHEGTSIESLQLRYNSLLACYNALSLVDPEYKWLAKPVIEDPRLEEEADEVMESEIQTQIVVIDIEEIRKELLVVEALLCVAKAKDLKLILHMGPKELVILLSTQKFFSGALKLAKGYKLSLTPIFESLTLACLKSSNHEFTDNLEWLNQNNLSDLTLTLSYSEMPWIYLKKMLDEEDSEKEYHRDVVKCVLANQAFVPQWLLDVYKLHKPSELLYLYLQFGRLDEAADLAVDYVRAYLGYGSEIFGFKYYAAKTLPSFPINTMDLLLHQLKVHGQKDKVCKENHSLLRESVDKYLMESNQITLESMAM